MVLASAVTALIRLHQRPLLGSHQRRLEERVQGRVEGPGADERLPVFVFPHLKKYDFWQHALLVKLESSTDEADERLAVFRVAAVEINSCLYPSIPN